MAIPKDLQKQGRALYRSIERQLGDDYELTETEQRVAYMAAKQADELAVAEQALSDTGPVIIGSRGQQVPNPLLAECRQQRQAITALLAKISFPSEDEPRPEPRRRNQSQQNTANAVSRWKGKRGA